VSSSWLPLWLVPLALACGGGGSADAPAPPSVNDPTQVGPLSAELSTIELELADRGSAAARVVAQQYAPSALDRGLPAPVVIFNHGFGARNDQYAELLSYLATWGFVVVAPQWDAGIGSTRTHAELASDLRQAIDWVEGGGLTLPYALDTDLIGVVGHSRGGKQALLAAADEPRIDAIVALDPVDAGPPFGDFEAADFPSVAPERLGDLSLPVLHVGMGRGPEGAVPCAPEGENYEAFWAGADADDALIVVPAGGHNDLLDACADGGGGLCLVCPAGDDPAATARIARGAAVAWLRRHLFDDLQFESWVAGGMAETTPEADALVAAGGAAPEPAAGEAAAPEDSDSP
jgi:chlorophyllase